MDISPHGLIKLTLSELISLQFTHVYSQVDMDDNAASIENCGQYTEISGYTEWVSLSSPKISIGWDWQLANSLPLRWTRIGHPRTNVFLQSANSAINLPIKLEAWQNNLNSLATVIDALPWQEVLPNYFAKN